MIPVLVLYCYLYDLSKRTATIIVNLLKAIEDSIYVTNVI